MSTVSEYEAGNKITFSAAKCISDPGEILTLFNQSEVSITYLSGHTIVAATSEGHVRILDTRDFTRGTAEIRVSQGAAGLIRSLAVSSDGHTLAVGHSSGYISLVDIRTGRLRTGFKVIGLILYFQPIFSSSSL